METATSYSISEAAEALNLSPKTIRRYIKAGKLPSTKVPTKFGDEYRITEIPEALKLEAQAQAEAQARVKVELVPAEEADTKLDAQLLYQENIRLAAQLGAATEKIRQLEEQMKLQENRLGPSTDRIRQLEELVRLLEAPKALPVITPQEAPVAPPRLPWWKRLFGRTS
jgi:MerR family transcriptional regulator, copper efflux regulator